MIPTTYLMRLAYDEAWTEQQAQVEVEEPRHGAPLGAALGRLLGASHPITAALTLRLPRSA